MKNFFADVAQSGFDFYSQNLIEVGVGVGVNGQNGAFRAFSQVLDQHTGDGGLARAALSGHSNGVSHWYYLLQ